MSERPKEQRTEGVLSGPQKTPAPQEGELTPTEKQELVDLKERYRQLDAGGGLYPAGTEEVQEMQRIEPRIRELNEKAKTPAQRAQEALAVVEADAYYGGGTMDDWKARMVGKIDAGDLKRVDIEKLADELDKLDNRYNELMSGRDGDLIGDKELTEQMREIFEQAKQLLPADYYGPRVGEQYVDEGHGDNLKDVITNYRSLLANLDGRKAV